MCLTIMFLLLIPSRLIVLLSSTSKNPYIYNRIASQMYQASLEMKWLLSLHVW